MTVARRLAFLVISLTAIVGIVAAQSAPKQKVTEKRSLDSKETKPLGQDHLSADKIVPPLAEQQSAPISNTQTAKSGEDIEIQRKLVKFTKWLAIVGALQFLALIVLRQKAMPKPLRIARRLAKPMRKLLEKQLST